MKSFVVWVTPLCACALMSFVPACTSSSDRAVDGGAAVPDADAGGPVSGEQDNHCHLADGGKTVQVTSAAACHPDASAPVDAAPGDSDGGADMSDYGPTVYNTAADDDDCKYHVEWSSTPIFENTDVTFKVVDTVLSTGKPLTGAAPRAEVFLDETHPAPNTNQVATETNPGTYTIGPIQFDKPGKWTVRFHVNEDCSDLSKDSPHGHAAFYVNVP